MRQILHRVMMRTDSGEVADGCPLRLIGSIGLHFVQLALSGIALFLLRAERKLAKTIELPSNINRLESIIH